MGSSKYVTEAAPSAEGNDDSSALGLASSLSKEIDNFFSTNPAVCTDCATTQAAKTLPLVFLPGIMGSRLNISGILWNPDKKFSVGYRWGTFANHTKKGRALSIANGATLLGDGEALTKDERSRGYGQVWNEYHDFLRKLHGLHAGGQKLSVHAMGYDWRQDILTTAAGVPARIEGILSTESSARCILVTHSMGGLVARASIKRSPQLADKIAGIIHIVQPAAGGVVLYRRLLSGANDKDADGTQWRAILGDDPGECQAVLSGVPGAIQLLPSKHYKPWLTLLGGAMAEQSKINEYYEGNQYPPSVMPWEYWNNNATDIANSMRSSLASHKKFHDEVGLYVPPKIPIHSICGTGVTTEIGVKIVGNGPDVERVTSSEGDGTVPLASALALGKENSSIVNNVVHDQACKSSEGRDHLRSSTDYAASSWTSTLA